MQTGCVRTSFQEGGGACRVSLAEDRRKGNKSSSRRIRVERVPVNTDDIRRVWGTKTSQTLHNQKNQTSCKTLRPTHSRNLFKASVGFLTVPYLSWTCCTVRSRGSGGCRTRRAGLFLSTCDRHKQQTLFIKGNRRRRLCTASTLMCLLEGSCVWSGWSQLRQTDVHRRLSGLFTFTDVTVAIVGLNIIDASDLHTEKIKRV